LDLKEVSLEAHRHCELALREQDQSRISPNTLVDMAKAGDIEGLKATIIKPYSSSPKAMAKYRDLAVIALEAQAVA
jgi:hypothetical protein